MQGPQWNTCALCSIQDRYWNTLSKIQKISASKVVSVFDGLLYSFLKLWYALFWQVSPLSSKQSLILFLSSMPASLALFCSLVGLPLWHASLSSDITPIDANGYYSMKLSHKTSHSSSIQSPCNMCPSEILQQLLPCNWSQNCASTLHYQWWTDDYIDLLPTFFQKIPHILSISSIAHSTQILQFHW